VQGTVLGIAVDLCALPYLLRLISRVLTKWASPFGHSQSAPTAPVGEEPQEEVWCVPGWRGGLESEASVTPPWPGPLVREMGRRRRPSGWRLDHSSDLSLGIWAGPGVARRPQCCLLGRAFCWEAVTLGTLGL